MIYRVAGGIGLTLLGISMLGIGFPSIFTAVALTIGGIALLFGI